MVSQHIVVKKCIMQTFSNCTFMESYLNEILAISCMQVNVVNCGTSETTEKVEEKSMK